MKKGVMMLIAKRFAASLSFPGRTMVSSYRRHAITVNIPVTEPNTAKIPKASGEYKRVRMGATIIASNWAKVVPVISLSISPKKDVFFLFIV